MGYIKIRSISTLLILAALGGALGRLLRAHGELSKGTVPALQREPEVEPDSSDKDSSWPSGSRETAVLEARSAQGSASAVGLLLLLHTTVQDAEGRRP